MGAHGWNDPHDVIPVSFREEYSECDSVVDALQRASARRSTTPDSERRRCPYCGGTQVKVKRDPYAVSHKRPEKYKCERSGCRHHFDQPADENTIPMTDERADAFEWTDPNELPDPDERGALEPRFAELDEQTRTALAIALCQPWHEPGVSYREAAPLFPHSHYWIGRRVRAWKDGEHRELVPDPTAAEPITVDEQGDATAVATDGGRRRRWAAYGND